MITKAIALGAYKPYTSSCHLYLVHTSPIDGKPACGFCYRSCSIHATKIDVSNLTEQQEKDIKSGFLVLEKTKTKPVRTLLHKILGDK